MEISLYTIPLSVDNRYYLYNSLSNALIEVDKEWFDIFENKENLEKLSLHTEEKEFYNTLLEKLFITKNRQDQRLSYVASIKQLRTITSKFHLTIAPTMDCPFSCPYCFETVKSKGTMSEGTQTGIVTYLNKLEKKPDYHITWFGGEPLMAIEAIEQLYNKLEHGYKKPYHSEMITTGYSIDDHTISVLKRINCTELQITLDGLPETHNKIKRNIAIRDPFGETIKGIKKLLEDGGFQVSVRVNITKSNSSEFLPLLSLLIKELGALQNWSYSPGLVLSRGILECAEQNKNDLISIEEVIPFALNTFGKYGYMCSWMNYPSNSITECAVRNPYSLTVDAQGYMYKCWETIGKKEWSFGQISDTGEVIGFNPVILNRFLHGADHLSSTKCATCSIHPICHGGCPYNWIVNTFENANRNPCSPYKTSIKDVLTRYIKSVECEEAKKHA